MYLIRKGDFNMALVDCKEPVFDRQVDEILKMLEDGIDREEIAEKLGYKNPISLDNYMRRRNFSWDSRQKNFVPASERYSGKGQNNILQLHGTSKAALILSLFAQGESDAKDIARQVGLETHKELASYMKNKGYEWDTEQENYVKKSLDKVNASQQATGLAQLGASATVAEVLENIIPLLKNLQSADHQSSQVKKSFEEAQSMPRYRVKGMYGTKAMRMANVLDELMRRYSKDKNISQREIVEVALIEFFQKYGYRDDIEGCFMD